MGKESVPELDEATKLALEMADFFEERNISPYLALEAIDILTAVMRQEE